MWRRWCCIAALVACGDETADPAKPQVLVTAGTLRLGTATITLLDVSNAKTKDGQCAIRPAQNGCNLIDCRDTVAPAFQPVLAGDITAGDGVSDPLDVTPDAASGWYSAQARIGPALWAAGTIVKVDVAGGADIPSFGVSAPMPGAPAMTSPVLAADGSTTIARAQPLALTWTGGTSGPESLYVLMLQQRPGDTALPPRFVELYCMVDGASGALNIPSDALTAFDADLGQTSTALGIGNVSTIHAVHGGYPILVSIANVVGGAITMQ